MHTLSQRSRARRSSRSFVLFAVAALGAQVAAHATVNTWTGATSLNWNDNTNWSAGVAPGSVAGYTAVFNVAPTGTVNIDASPLTTLRGITIGSGTGGTGGTNVSNITPVNITGQTLTLAGGLETESGTATNARTVFFARSAAGTATFVIDNNLVLDVTGTNSSRFLLAGLVKSLTLNGVISSGSTTAASGNNKGIAKDGDGVLTLTNAGNSYLGTTEITAGTLIAGGDVGTTSGVFGTGAGAVTLGNSNTGAAQNIALLTNGSFTIGRDILVASPVTGATGTVSIGNTGSSTGASIWNGNVTLNRTTELSSSGSATADFNGVITGTGGVTKTNTGTVRVNNAGNNFSGAVTIQNGTLTVQALSALGANTAAITFGNVTTAVTGTLSYSGNSTTLDRDIVVQTLSTGGGNIDVSVAGQKLTIGSALRSVTGIGRFVFGGFGDVDVASIVANTGNPVIKSGTGVGRLLNVNNTYTGQTFVRNGPLLIDAAGQLGATAGITLIDSTSIAASSPSFLTTSGITITPNILIDEVVGGGATGVSTIGAASTQTASSTTYSGNVTLNRNVQLTSDTSAGLAVNFSGQIADGVGSYGLAKIGSGTVALSNANNTYTGATQVKAGTLIVQGSNVGNGSVTVDAGATLGGSGSIAGEVIVNGKLSPGAADAIGSLSLGPALTVNADATTSVQLGAAATIDHVAVAGTATLGGTLQLLPISDYVPAYGQAHRVLDAASVANHFATVAGSKLAAKKWLAVTYDATGVNVTAALPGDANLSNTVNFDDLIALAQNYNGTDKVWAQGDFDGSGTVNFDDLIALAQNYNQSAVAGSALLPASFAADWALAQTLVPEPTALVAITGVFLLTPRRPRK